MAQITEIGPDVYRITTYVPQINLQFNQFLVLDDEPLLYHTGLRRIFPGVREAVASLTDPALIRWIGFSHLEADECGALRDWQEIALPATAVCSLVAKSVSIDDFVALRPARALNDGEVLETGRHRFRFIQTPHVPHCWEAGHLYEETSGILFCSDLFHQVGDVEAVTRSSVVGRFKEMLIAYQKTPLAYYLPLTPQTERSLAKLAALKPRVIATMHGSTYVGDGEHALQELAAAVKEVMGTA